MKRIRSSHQLLRLAVTGSLCCWVLLALIWSGATGIQYAQQPRLWIEAGQDFTLPAELLISNPHGKLGVLNTSGPVQTKDHPFFEALGLNPRGCVTCHQPADAMSVSVESLRERWRVTKGEDPIFAAVDGSNNPKLAQALESSHSLLLKRGVFRVGLPWPPRDRNGKVIQPEFSIEVVRDPTGVNLDETYGLTGVNPTVSVFRRPRPVANLKYVLAPAADSAAKPSTAKAADAEMSQHFSQNLMADARHLTLQQQAFGAYKDHQEGRQGQLSRPDMEKILAFENQIYVAQSFDQWGGSLVEPGGPNGLGPQALAAGQARRATDNPASVFGKFESWRKLEVWPKELTEQQRAFRLSVARGNEVFVAKPILLRGIAHSDAINLGKAAKQTCATCHVAPLTGQALAAGWVDLGTTNAPTWTEPPVASDNAELPIFKCTCVDTAPPHPFLGRVIFTNDPGRALITGKCTDIGSIVMGQLRGLAARAPYFVNGSAKTLRDVVEFHARRFELNVTEQEKTDLVNFLSVL